MNCRGTTASFRRFLPVVPLRKLLFSVFHRLYPYEDLFLPFFIDRTPTPSDFLRFSVFVGVRSAVFPVFCSS